MIICFVFFWVFVFCIWEQALFGAFNRYYELYISYRIVFGTWVPNFWLADNNVDYNYIDIVGDVDDDAPPGVVLHGSLPRPTSNEPAPTNMTSYFLRLRENDVRRYIWHIDAKVWLMLSWLWWSGCQDLWSTMQCITLVPPFVSLLTADLYDSCISLVPFYPICFPDDVIVDDVGGQEVSNVSLLCPLLYHSCITLPSSYLPAGHLYSQPTIGHFHSDWDKIFVVEILQNAINDITQTFTRILIKETKHILQVSVPNYQIHYDIIKKKSFQPL